MNSIVTKYPRLKAILSDVARHIQRGASENIVSLIGVSIAILISVLAAYWSWEFWGESSYKNGQLHELKIDRGRIIQQSLILVGGIIALILAVWRSHTASQQAKAALRQVELAQRGQNTERFQKAVDMLGGESLTVRRAGVFALKENAGLDLPGSYVASLQTLLTFVQEHSSRTIDAADAFVIIGQLRALHDPENTLLAKRLELPYHVLRDVNIADAPCLFTDFSFLRFIGCSFERVFFNHSIVSNCYFENCTFESIDTTYADFSQSIFDRCRFRNCTLEGASFADTHFKRTIFVRRTGATFDAIDLSGANFLEVGAQKNPNIISEKAFYWDDKPIQLPKHIPNNARSANSSERRMETSKELADFVRASVLKFLPREDALRRASELGIPSGMLRHFFDQPHER